MPNHSRALGRSPNDFSDAAWANRASTRASVGEGEGDEPQLRRRRAHEHEAERRRPDRRRRDPGREPQAEEEQDRERQAEQKGRLRRAERAQRLGQFALHDVARRLGGRGGERECDRQPACVRLPALLRPNAAQRPLSPHAGRRVAICAFRIIADASWPFTLKFPTRPWSLF
jgi:hypothetical protein